MKHVIIALLFFLSSSAIADKVQVYGIEIEGLHQADGRGEYDQIINNILVKNGKATMKVVPPDQIDSIFDKCDRCCWSPANKSKEFYQYGSKHLQTEPMGLAKIYIFSLPGSGKKYSNFRQLSGLKVGYRDGMPYGRTFDSFDDFQKIAAPTIEDNISKLEAGILDVFVAYVPDAYSAFENLNKEIFPHEKSRPAVIHPDALVCKGVNYNFIDFFDNKIRRLRRSKR